MFWRNMVYAIAVIFFVTASLVGFFIWPKEQQLVVTSEVIASLKKLQQSETFADLPGVDPSIERLRMKTELDDLLTRLIRGLESNPRKSWVLAEFKPTVARIHLEDTEARERFVDYLQQILESLKIESTNGAFIRYMIFI